MIDLAKEIDRWGNNKWGTRRRFADKLNKSTTSIAQWISRKSIPGDESIKAMAKELGLSADDLRAYWKTDKKLDVVNQQPVNSFRAPSNLLEIVDTIFLGETDGDPFIPREGLDMGKNVRYYELVAYGKGLEAIGVPDGSTMLIEPRKGAPNGMRVLLRRGDHLWVKRYDKKKDTEWEVVGVVTHLKTELR